MFEIGSSLREARIRQDLGFEEMEARTKVRAKYLRYLEEDRFDQLPGHAYTKGFLQVYADELGLASTSAPNLVQPSEGRTGPAHPGSRASHVSPREGSGGGVTAGRRAQSEWPSRRSCS